MENKLNIRLIYENNNYEIIIQPEETLLNLKQKIKVELESKNIVKNLDLNDISIKMGFPPKTIEGNSEDNKNMKELSISNNEQLRLEIKNTSFSSQSMSQSQTSTQINNQPNDTSKLEPIDFSKYSIQRKIIPADNSCLFNSINYAINQNLNEPQLMRELIATEILSNPDIYNSAILEKDPDQYSDWIMRNDTWGGGIELSVLTKLLNIKLAVSDIKNCTIQYFGEVIFKKYFSLNINFTLLKSDNF
jgi:ubiquitin thioesterase OTU1